jgi:hypothetical protein
LAAAQVPLRTLRACGRLKLVQHAMQVAGLALCIQASVIVGYELEGNLVSLMAGRHILGSVPVVIQTHNSSSIHAEVGTPAA